MVCTCSPIDPIDPICARDILNYPETAVGKLVEESGLHGCVVLRHAMAAVCRGFS
jgi:hypothetical protein